MLLISIFEIIGTIAFAVSGAIVGIEKKLDIFGVCILSITTAVGGGIFRDLVIGNVPPTAFRNPIYCLIGLASALFTYCFYKRISNFKNLLLLSDAIGLGVFTAVGANAALANNLAQPFIVVSMGLATGIGGGILRDVFAQDIPFVFRKEIYALASIFGGISFYMCYGYMPKIISLYVCFIITFIIRMFSIRRGINLPIKKCDVNVNFK